MKCPVCNVDLLMTDKQGVEIDYCPTCRGIWLDRGELEKLIERMSAVERSYEGRERVSHQSHGHPGHDKHGHEKHGHGQPGYHHGKQESIWHKMFDF
ncbi:MAG TPA: zf-TFIIB domain-containing protein [Gallionella sp.]|nr:zf-TFIIB domain-containing protein [Gallionella sp.]